MKRREKSLVAKARSTFLPNDSSIPILKLLALAVYAVSFFIFAFAKFFDDEKTYCFHWTKKDRNALCS